MEDTGECCELEQLVSSDGEGDDGEDTLVPEEPPPSVRSVKPAATHTRERKVKSPISPVVSQKVAMSSIGDYSQGSVSQQSVGGHTMLGNSNSSGNILSSSRLMYVNEKRTGKDPKGTLRARNEFRDSQKSEISHHSFVTEVPDVRHMERALIGLLADFHSGKLRAFGAGCSMEQMTNIREQQERLARLHFDLGGAGAMNEPPLSADGLRTSQNTMSQLVQRLEQLSVSIEQLHANEP